jgi:RecG-like helicase
MLFYVVMKPDRTPVETPFLTQTEAQQEIEAIEPDVLKRNHYVIYPISQLSDLRDISVKPCETITLEKFDGEFVGQAPVEVIERKF